MTQNQTLQYSSSTTRIVMIILIKKMHLFFLTYKLWCTDTHTDTGQYTDTKTSTLIKLWENDIIQCNHMCRCQAPTRFKHWDMYVFDHMCWCRTLTRLRHQDMSSITCDGVHEQVFRSHVWMYTNMCRTPGHVFDQKCQCRAHKWTSKKWIFF